MHSGLPKQALPLPEPPADRLERIRVRCGARLPLSQFVGIVSNTYHELEAPFYDQAHPELRQHVPPILEAFLDRALPALAGDQLRAVDLGCGTGFASALLLGNATRRIAECVCVDPSPHMLARWRENLRGNPQTSYLDGGIEALAGQEAGFDLVMTCSTIHHIVRVGDFLSQLALLVKPGGFYLMLHEPSRRFYRNPECLRLLADCAAGAHRRPLRRYFDPRAYLRALRRILHWRGAGSIQQQTSRRLQRNGITKQPLREDEIAALVDVHAPPLGSDPGALQSVGFDVEELAADSLAALTLMEFRSYGFLGPYPEETTSRECREQAGRLAARFPGDGATFCALWRKP